MKFNKFFLVFLFSSHFLFAQKLVDFCSCESRIGALGLHHVSEEDVYPNLEKNGYFDVTSSYENFRFLIPIKFWLYLPKGVNPDTRAPELKRYIRELNKINVENNTGMLYFMNPDIGVIRTKKKLVMSYYEQYWMAILHKNRKSINIHLPDYLSKWTDKGDKNSYTLHGNYNYLTKTAYVRKDASSSTVAHEVGHYFALLHPHKDFNKGKCKQEAVSRERVFKGCFFKHGRICEKSGDRLCDTPAEPMLGGLMSSDCKYYGGVKDIWGDSYTPMTNNVMSYPVNLKCRTSFTPGQIALMQIVAEKKGKSFWKKTSKFNNKDVSSIMYDEFEPDNTMAFATEFVSGIPQKHSFGVVKTTKNTKVLDLLDWLEVKNAAVVEFKISGKDVEKNILIKFYNKQGIELQDGVVKKELGFLICKVDFKTGGFVKIENVNKVSGIVYVVE